VSLSQWVKAKNQSMTGVMASPSDGNLERQVAAKRLALGALGIPVFLILVLGWTHRWTADDCFISVRYVPPIFPRRGPVFNAGGRVEVLTSPLCVLWLVGGKIVLFWLPVEWVVALLGLSMTVGAVILALRSAWRAHRSWRLLPIGILAYVMLPPAAVFAT